MTLFKYLNSARDFFANNCIKISLYANSGMILHRVFTECYPMYMQGTLELKNEALKTVAQKCVADLKRNGFITLAVVMTVRTVLDMVCLVAKVRQEKEVKELPVKRLYANFLYKRLVDDFDKVQEKYLNKQSTLTPFTPEAREQYNRASEEICRAIILFRDRAKKILTAPDHNADSPGEILYDALQEALRELVYSRVPMWNIDVPEELLTFDQP